MKAIYRLQPTARSKLFKKFRIGRGVELDTIKTAKGVSFGEKGVKGLTVAFGLSKKTWWNQRRAFDIFLKYVSVAWAMALLVIADRTSP